MVLWYVIGVLNNNLKDSFGSIQDDCRRCSRGGSIL